MKLLPKFKTPNLKIVSILFGTLMAGTVIAAEEAVQRISLKNIKVSSVVMKQVGGDANFGDKGELQTVVTLTTETQKLPVVVTFPFGVEAQLVEAYLKDKGVLVLDDSKTYSGLSDFYEMDYKGPLRKEGSRFYELSDAEQETLQKLYLQQEGAVLHARDIPMGALISFVYRSKNNDKTSGPEAKEPGH